MNSKLALPFLALAAIPFAQRSSTPGSSRQPVAPTLRSVEEIQVAPGGVPRGHMILGETAEPPRGFTYTGKSLLADDGVSSFIALARVIHEASSETSRMAADAASRDVAAEGS